MALFKILRGKSVNLSKQAKTDGWAWFTSDTGSFYIDAQNDFATVERIKINPKSFFIEIDLYSDNGIVLDAANKLLYVYNDNFSTFNYNNYNIMITLSNSATWQAKKNYSLGNYTIVESGNGYIVLHTNALPTDSTPLRITFIPKEYEVSYITFQVDGNTYTAIQGMTWREWVNSSLNTDGWIWEDQYGVCRITSQDEDSREGVCIEISHQNGEIGGGLYISLAWMEKNYSGGIYT